jgi:hypothetical protein
MPNLSTLESDVGISVKDIIDKSEFNVADVESAVSQMGIAILTLDTAIGNWEFSEVTGVWNTITSTSATNAFHLTYSDTNKIRFVPTSSTSVGTTGITFAAWDQSNSGSITNKRGNASTRGNSTAYSTQIGTISRGIITAPSNPRNIKAIVSSTDITFTWDAPILYGYGDETNITYNVYDDTNTLINTGATKSFIVTKPVTTPYSFSISAYNGLLEGNKATSISYLEVPVLNTIVRSHMKFDLSWSVPYTQNTGASSLSYEILDASDNVIKSNISSSSTAITTGLTANQSYTYKVRATIGTVVAVSDTATAIAAFIPIPVFIAPLAGDGVITIAWNDTSSLVKASTFLGYKIYFSKDNGTEYVTDLIDQYTMSSVGSNSTGFGSISVNSGTIAVFGGLTNGSSYKFRIVTVASIDSIEQNSSYSTSISTIPIAPTITVNELSSSIQNSTAGGDTAAAVAVVTQIVSSGSSGVTKIADTFTSLISSSGNAGSGNADGNGSVSVDVGAIFTSLASSSAASVLSEILTTADNTVKTQLLEQAIATNPAKAGDIISTLNTVDERASAITAATANLVDVTTSIISAAASTGIIVDANVAQAVGAADVSARITVTEIKTDTTSVVTNFSAAITDISSLGSVSTEQKNAIVTGAADTILKAAITVSNDSSVSETDKTSAVANVLTAVLTESNTNDSLKNTFVEVVTNNFAGEVIPITGDPKDQFLDSIPEARILVDLIVPDEPVSIVVPNANIIELSTITNTLNQALIMKIDEPYQFKNKDNVMDTNVSVTYKNDEDGIRRYLDISGTRVYIGDSIKLFGKNFFLAAGGNATGSVVPDPTLPTITGIQIGDTILTVTFTKPSVIDGAPVSNYYYSTDNGVTYSLLDSTVNNDVTNIIDDATSKTFTINNLQNDFTYTVKIKTTYNAIPAVESTGVSATPSARPPAPTNVTATPTSNKITINFTPVSGISTYKYTINSGAAVSVTSTGTINITNGVSNGNTYSIQLFSTNSAGDSDPVTINNILVNMTYYEQLLYNLSQIGINTNTLVTQINALDMINPINLNNLINISSISGGNNKTIARENLINLIFELHPSVTSFTVVRTTLGLSSSKPNIINAVVLKSNIISSINITNMLSLSSSVYLPVNSVGNSDYILQNNNVSLDITKNINSNLFNVTIDEGTTQSYSSGSVVKIGDFVIELGTTEIILADANLTITPVTVNLDVKIIGQSAITVLGDTGPVLPTNIIIPEVTLPVNALYDSTDNSGLIEIWEPTTSQNDIYVQLASSADFTVDGQAAYKVTAKQLAKGLQRILCDKFNCINAEPYNNNKYKAAGVGIPEYTVQRDFGRVALGCFAHYMFGHVDATAAISNDIQFVRDMLSLNNNTAGYNAAQNESNTGAADRYTSFSKQTIINTTDIDTWSAVGSASDANLAIRLVKAIVAKGLNSDGSIKESNVNASNIDGTLAKIAKQVVGQDQTRLTNVDNSQRTKDVHQLLRFYPGDIIFVNIELEVPSVTVGLSSAEQQALATTLQNSYYKEGSSRKKQNYTLKITLGNKETL